MLKNALIILAFLCALNSVKAVSPGNITNIWTSPTSGPVNTVFFVFVDFNITTPYYYGKNTFTIQPPGNIVASSMSTNNYGYQPGTYQLKYEINTSLPYNGRPYVAGKYQITVALIDGAFGHASEFTNGTVYFNLS